MLDFLKLIESKGYITVSKELARNIGLDETMILTELLSKYNYWKDKEKLTEEGYFYITIKDLKHETTLTKYRQTQAINNLKKMNLIKTKKQGLPAKRYFTISEKEIIKLFFKIDEKEEKKSDKPRNDQEVKNSKTREGKSGKLKVKNSTQLRTNNKNKLKEEEEGENSQFKNLEKITTLFEQVFNKKMQPFHLKLLKNYDYQDEIVTKALKDSGTHNAQSFQYTLKLLKNWSNRDITTVEEIERLQRQFNSSDEEQTMEDFYKKGYR